MEEIWDAEGAALDDLHPRRWDDQAGYGACMEILRDWEYDAGWADSELVIDTERSGNRNPLCMTADGVLSHQLWLAITLATLWRQGTTIDVAQTRQLLTHIACAEIQWNKGRRGLMVVVMMRTRCVDGHAVNVCLPIAQADKADIEKRGKNQIMYTMNFATLCFFTAVWNRSFGAQTRVHPPSSTRNLQALDRLFARSGNCARGGWIGFPV